jgi:hypothetical protein
MRSYEWTQIRGALILIFLHPTPFGRIHLRNVQTCSNLQNLCHPFIACWVRIKTMANLRYPAKKKKLSW